MGIILTIIAIKCASIMYTIFCERKVQKELQEYSRSYFERTGKKYIHQSLKNKHYEQGKKENF